MASKHDELSRFTESGKTFFFNCGRASNDTEYLAINALYGKGQQQRLVLFPAQFLSFHKHLLEAIKRITGMTISEAQAEADVPALLPRRCPTCDYDISNYSFIQTDQYWAVYCTNCREAVFSSREID